MLLSNTIKRLRTLRILQSHGTTEKTVLRFEFWILQKHVRNVAIFNWELKKSLLLFFVSVQWISLFIEQISTHLTMHCPICLFHTDNHICLLGTLIFVERISWQNGTPENIIKKDTSFFNISDIFYKIQKLKLMASFFQ